MVPGFSLQSGIHSAIYLYGAFIHNIFKSHMVPNGTGLNLFGLFLPTYRSAGTVKLECIIVPTFRFDGTKKMECIIVPTYRSAGTGKMKRIILPTYRSAGTNEEGITLSFSIAATKP
jgi:hypothetical protein